MVKDHSDSERSNLLPPHWLLFPISIRCSLYAPSHRQDNTYYSIWYTSRGAQFVHHERWIWRPITPSVNALTMELHLAPNYMIQTKDWQDNKFVILTLGIFTLTVFPLFLSLCPFSSPILSISVSVSLTHSLSLFRYLTTLCRQKTSMITSLLFTYLTTLCRQKD